MKKHLIFLLLVPNLIFAHSGSDTVNHFFDWCVVVFEVIGDVTGLGYYLANIIVFVVIQPLLIFLFLILWIFQRRKNIKFIKNKI